MRQSLALAWVSFAFLTLGASPAHYWLDAGEITSAGLGLGVMHPPGTPGLVPLLYLAALVPVGSVGFRMGVLSCALAAAAIVTMFAILQRRNVHWLIGWGAAAWVLAGLTFVRNARVVEIYAFGAAATMLFVWGFDAGVDAERRTSRRLIGTAAAVVGAWGFGDLRLVLVPTVAVLWLVALRRGEAWARWAPVVVGVFSLVVLTLPLASAHAPVADWGDPQTFDRLYSHVMAEPIRAAFADEILPRSVAAWSLNFEASFGAVVEDLGPFGPVFLVAGVLAWALRPGDRGLLLLLLLLLVAESFYAVGVNPMGIADRQTGFSWGLLAALVVGVNLHAWTAARPRVRWAATPMVWTALVLPAAALSLPDHATTRSWMPHAWSRDALAQLPPGSTLLTQSDDLAAGCLAARVVEGARPDVVVIAAQHLHKGGPDESTAREAAVWRVASTGGSESGRIIDVLTHPPRPPAPLGLELPGVGVFASVPFAADRGFPPLAISGGPADLDRARRLERTFDVWLPRIESRADASRLSRAVDLTLRGWLRGGTIEPTLLTLAEDSYVRLQRELDGEDAGVLLSLGAIHDATGRTGSAIRLSRRALELEPGRNAGLLTLALYLSRDPATQGEALRYAERAVALRPLSIENWARLAQVAAAAGDADRARQARDIANDLRARELPAG